MQIERYRDAAVLEALQAACGWERPRAETERKLSVHPDANFVARDERGAPLGCVSVALHRDADGVRLAWIGSMLVRPDAQRQGVGRALLATAVAAAREAGARAIGLDATEAGRPLYEKVGFRAVGRVPRWVTDAIPDTLPPSRASIYPISSCEIMELHAYDAARFGANRSPWLASVMAAHPERAFVAFDRASGAVAGYVLGAERFVGPLVADDAAIAQRLLHATRRAGTPGTLFAPDEPAHAAALEAAGWRRGATSCTRMLLEGEMPGKADAIYAITAYAVG